MQATCPEVTPFAAQPLGHAVARAARVGSHPEKDAWYGSPMSSTARAPSMTREEFFPWAERQDRRYEFDGFDPVAMTGGSMRHDFIQTNIVVALRDRLRGSGCRPSGPDAGLATVGDTIRYPDVLITCDGAPPGSRLATSVVAVFEIVSPGGSAIDRVVKLREYLAVASIQAYVIVEQDSMVLTQCEREGGAWRVTTLGAEDTWRLHDPAVEVPVTAFYEDVEF